MSDSEDENYAAFGIPLEPLDEENLPRKKAITIEDQYAYDTQGRRRFHGAFTGGFSAGYFNTVGTRDGWKPQQFKSSRGSKAKAIEQQPEDFMDEEDVSIFGIAPKGIRANSDYEYHGQKGTKRGRAEMISNQSLSHNPVLKELLRPVRETVGIILLKKMGWKPGQGIGNRVTRREKVKARKRIEKINIYGCVSPQGKDKEADSNIDDSDEDTVNITFAPDDYDPFRFKGKDNYFGIGYSGLNRQNILSTPIGTECNYQSSNKSLPIFGHAFGVGAFEVDDDDIYEKEDMSRYDSVLGPERKSKTRWSVNNILSNDKVNNCIDGFVHAIDKLNCKKIFTPPHLPKDYHHAVHLTRKSRFYPPIPHESINERKKVFSIADRCRILSDINVIDKTVQIDRDEKALPCKISITASNLTTESSISLKHRNTENDKDLQQPRTRTNTSWVSKLNAKEFISGGVTGMEEITPGLLNKSKNLNNCHTFTNVDKQISKIPLSTDLDKQKSVESSLTSLEVNDKHKLEQLQPVQSLAKWERDQEFIEFNGAAKLIDQVETNDTNTKGPNDSGTKVINSLEKEMNETTKIEMFGKLTREISEWQPASIVCKRFNVPEPKNSYVQIKSEKKLKISVFNSLNLDMLPTFLKANDIVSKDVENETSITPENKLITNHPSTSSTQFNISNNETQIATEKEKNFEASYEKIFGRTVYDKHEETKEEKFENSKPKVVCIKNSEEKKDLYRAIFLSSSEESETEEEEDMDKEVVKSVLIGDTLNDINTTRNMSPPRGIFAKLDLGDLVVKPKNVDTGSIEENIKHKQKNLLQQPEPQTILNKNLENDRADILQTTIQPDVYGPILPSRLIKNGNASTDPVESTESSRPIYKSVVIPKVAEKFQGQWVEVYKTKKSKKIKKKHKHKEHKSSKSKRKSKKHKH